MIIRQKNAQVLELATPKNLKVETGYCPYSCCANTQTTGKPGLKSIQSANEYRNENCSRKDAESLISQGGDDVGVFCRGFGMPGFFNRIRKWLAIRTLRASDLDRYRRKIIALTKNGVWADHRKYFAGNVLCSLLLRQEILQDHCPPRQLSTVP